ncbi:MAG: NAD(P)/FAD-dependent oxidoreductase, partial [Mesorhizobium sp.]
RAGEMKARHFIQATGAWTGPLAQFSSHLTNFSSHICLSEPISDLESVIWPSRKPFYDARPFINYLRTTGDRRIVIGSGSGEPSFRNRVTLADFVNPGAWTRARAAFSMLVAGSNDIAFDSCWGGPIDISSDRLPFVGCFPGTRHYFGAGQSGHGIIPSCMMAHCIASTLLGEDDRWSRLRLNRGLPNKRFPPEPLRYAGGRLIQKAALRRAADLDSGRKGRTLDRLLLGLPKTVGLDLGLR